MSPAWEIIPYMQLNGTMQRGKMQILYNRSASKFPTQFCRHNSKGNLLFYFNYISLLL